MGYPSTDAGPVLKLNIRPVKVPGSSAPRTGTIVQLLRRRTEADAVRIGQTAHGEQPATNSEFRLGKPATAGNSPPQGLGRYCPSHLEKHRDWTEQNSKLQFSISKYKELIHSI
jgi:hypothetical protein